MTHVNDKFFDGLFSRGDLPPSILCDYAMYMHENIDRLPARLTEGEEVGVGCLNTYMQLGESDCAVLNEFGGEWTPRENWALSFSSTFLFMPGIGFWICVPMSHDVEYALQDAQEVRWVCEETIRRHHANGDCPAVDPGAVGFGIALLAACEGPWDLSAVDGRNVFLPETFSNFAEELRNRAHPCDPDALDAAVRFLAERGYLRDSKSADNYTSPYDSTVPSWVGKYIELHGAKAA